MGELDRTKHDFDVLEHVFGGVLATATDDDSPLVCPAVLQPELVTGIERDTVDTEIVVLERDG